MLNFSCPVCGKILFSNGKTYKCENVHSFDIAKQGYVNLLQSQQSRLKRHGDDKLMVRARNEFLNRGYYSPLLNALCATTEQYLPYTGNIIDAGCGDCYYSAGLYDKLADKKYEIAGIDISKDALIFASRRNKKLMLAVGSVFSIPVPDCCADAVLNIFSPLAADEYLRILRQGGFLFRTIPLENHLIGLKEKIYDNPYKNDIPNFELDGFKLLEDIQIKYDLELDNQNDIANLFKMTPYYYKTSAKDQNKVSVLERLKTPVEFSILIYKKL